MEDAQAQERAERALKRGALNKKWWLSRIKGIHREVETIERSIEEEGSTEAQLNKLEQFRNRGEKAGRWLKERGVVVKGSPESYKDKGGTDSKGHYYVTVST